MIIYLITGQKTSHFEMLYCTDNDLSCLKHLKAKQIKNSNSNIVNISNTTFCNKIYFFNFYHVYLHFYTFLLPVEMLLATKVKIVTYSEIPECDICHVTDICYY